jgi:hypothetical protein
MTKFVINVAGCAVFNKFDLSKTLGHKEDFILTRKLLVVSAVMALVCGSALFAEENKDRGSGEAAAAGPKFTLSAGGGGVFVTGFGGRHEGNDAETLFVDLGGGAFMFLDATFAELSVGYTVGRTFTRTKSGGQTTEDWVALSVLDVDLLGKYPFNVNDRISVFPLLGVNYQYAFSSGDENTRMIRLGAGMDFKVTEKLYLRPQLLSGIRLAREPYADFRTRLALGYTF